MLFRISMKSISVIFLIVIPHQLFAQTIYVYGYVTDNTGENLIGANIVDIKSNSSTVSNQYGYYNLIIEGESAEIVVSYVGYKSYHFKISSTGGLHNVSLEPEVLKEIIITGNIAQTESGQIRVEANKLKSIPTLGGVPDVIKNLSYLPGVSIGVEGTSSLYVRGGNPSENLILLDDAPVYNTSHLFGFISIFNPDVIKSIDVFKGNFPARYGGRLSSVIDVRMIDGNTEETEAEFGIGLIESRIAIKGPISKKSTYLFAARTSYLDLLQLPRTISYLQGKISEYTNYRLFDINAKWNYRFNDYNNISFSFSLGHDSHKAINSVDIINKSSTLGIKWSNQTATIRYRHIFKDNLFGNFVGIYSRYNKKIGIEESYQDYVQSINSFAQIQDYTLKGFFDWQPFLLHEFQFGYEINYFDFIPDYLESSGLGTYFSQINTSSLAIYLQDRYQLAQSVILQVGIRSPVFLTPGKTYINLEPRISLYLTTNKIGQFNVGYTKMQQNIHLLSSSNIGFANDIWIPSTKTIEPGVSEQISLEWKYNTPWYGVEISVGSYFKSSNNLIDYKAGTNLLQSVDNNWENQIETKGVGKAYGIEFSLQKSTGDLTGLISYTWSRSYANFVNRTAGQWRPAKYDRPHDFSITGKYKLSKHWEILTTWVYSTGLISQLPIAITTDIQGFKRPLYSGFGLVRAPDYHRMDIGLRRTKIKKEKERVLSFGVYNVYNRINPFYIDYFYSDELNQGIIINQGAFPALPYISYSIKF